MLTYRHNKILEFVHKNGFCAVEELAQHLNTSAMTIRRDFIALEKERLITRVHGGAIPVENLLVSTHIASRIKAHISEKQKIAAYAAALIERDDTVFVDAGSTCSYLAESFPENRSITVITHSLNIINILKNKVGINIICTGGGFQEREGAFGGAITESCLSSFFVNKSFVGAAGISLEMGCASNNIDESKIKAIMHTRARQSFILADASKFSSPAFHTFLPLEQIKNIITDDSIAPNLVKKYRESGIEIILAS
jgi:DeoR/GlpR family transcriptional regulator of sugar metabolism